MCDQMKWTRLLAEKRFRPTGVYDEGEENGRTQFQKDIDRITFSSAFRRLGRKTQVHLLSKNDHIHTRLSHSLEVACAGRSMGVMVGQWLKDKNKKGEYELPDKFSPSKIGEIVQAACLAHDIGNPPFGHAAEDAIRKWFQDEMNRDLKMKLKEEELRDLERFDGNAMAFRVVTYKEYNESEGGMRLTYPTLGALMKYPRTSHFAGKKHKFSCFKTEYETLSEIAGELGLIEKTRIEKTRDKEYPEVEYAHHPLAYLVEAADDICYRVLDIEDAIELNLLTRETLKDKFQKILEDEGELNREQERLLNKPSTSWRIKNGLLRGKMIGLMIKETINAFKQHYDEIMDGRFEGDLFSSTDSNSLCLALKDCYKEEKLTKKIYQNQRNVPLELGAYSVLRMLLEASMESASEIVEGNPLSYRTEITMKFMKQDGKDRFQNKSLYEVIVLFLDYVTGMTDDFATYMNRLLLGLGN